MTITKISSDQLTFRSAITGDHLLDTYLENAERGTKTLGEIIDGIVDANGDFDPALINIEIRLNPGIPDQLEFRINGGPWIVAGTIPVPPGGGDMVGGNNLSELTNLPLAQTNLGLGALSTLNTVNTAQINDDAITLAKLAHGTPITLYGKDGAGVPTEITIGAGINLAANELSGGGVANYDVIYEDGVDFTAGNPAIWALPLPVDPVSEENLSVYFDGVLQFPDPANYTFNAVNITFTNGFPALINKVRVRISL